MTNILTVPALRRKALYISIAAVLMVGVVLGKFTPEQSDTWAATVMSMYDQAEPFIAALALSLAAKKATPAADDPTTVKDVEDARVEARDAAMKDVRQVVEAAVHKAADSIDLPIYRGPTSQ